MTEEQEEGKKRDIIDVSVDADSGDDQDKKGMTAKDWTTLIFSVLALVISAASAYWNIIRQVDDVRVMIEGSPSIGVSGGKIISHFGPPMTFINLGNRSAAISSVSLSIAQNDPERCKYGPHLEWSASSAPSS
jgi:hypothetical protein